MALPPPNAIKLFLGTQFPGAAVKARWSVMVSDVSLQSWELRLGSSLKLRGPILAGMAGTPLPRYHAASPRNRATVSSVLTEDNSASPALGQEQPGRMKAAVLSSN